MNKKLFAVSDIHGYYTLFKQALDSSGFERNNPNHLLVFCGDMIDRGNENREVLQFFAETENCIIIRGNHEDHLLKIFKEGRLDDHSFVNGSIATITDFFGWNAINNADHSVDFSGGKNTVHRLTEFISSMRDYYETPKYIFTHGWLPNSDGAVYDNWKNASEPDWIHARITKWTDMYTGAAPLKGKILVCGHIPAFFAERFDRKREDTCAEPFFGNGLIAIDGGTHDTGKVNIIVLEDDIP